MAKIAICGGIGSGKSAVSSILRSLGAKVIVADEVNAQLLTEPSYVREIANTFPSVVHNDSINKKELAEIVFSNEKERAKLMSLAHSRIFERMMQESEICKISFFEIPLMTLCPISFDLIWFVSASREKRIERIVARDGVSIERAKRLIDLQSNEMILKKKADLIFENDGDIDILSERVRVEYCHILEQFS